ncbi:MAG: LacI family transcriptional regulator [Ahrensia sp.]|nr:LacI family transcriptional regulator [Ahrensia sp.]
MAQKTKGKQGDGAELAAGPPTLKSIAFMTGYSITTVSRALKDAPDIGQEAKDRVRLVAKQIGYRPNRAGVRLRTGKTNVISLVLNTQEEVMGLTSQMVLGISDVLRGTPYHLVVTPYSLDNDAMEPVRYVVETGSADGVILSRIELQDRRVRYLSEHGMPFATHGRTDMGIDHPWHDFDNERFARDAVDRLAKRGVKRAALVGPPDNLTYARHMKAGFATGLREHGMQQVAFDTVTVDDTLDTIQAGVYEIMRAPDRPDGIVCGSGGGAIAASAGIEQAGLEIGRDVQIVSKQHTNILKRYRKEIEVINEDVRQGGRDLATCVIRSIEGVPASELHFLSYPDDPADTPGVPGTPAEAAI